ncbi:MAG: proline dehydrogenase [Flavobacteriales bacterium]|jgi:proline dehydrogenase
MALNFSNTEIAFKSKSNKELKKANLLFKMVAKPWLVKFGKWATNFAFKLRLPVIGLIKKTIFSQFCGGENIEECTPKINELYASNIGTILDYSLEGKESNVDLDETCQEVIETIERAKNEAAIPFAVFKPSGISKFSILEKANESTDNLSEEDRKDFDLFIDRLDQICKKAAELKVSVLVDAEDSWIQGTIDRETEKMMFKYNQTQAIVINTIQLYRHDRLQYLKDLHTRCLQKEVLCGVKLVRGAYMEKERNRAAEKGYRDPIQPNKEACDRDYNLALEFCVDQVESILTVAGSHNEKSAAHLSELLEEKSVDKNHPHIYFAQLLGMSDHISYNLSSRGHNVAKYVPYGPVKEVMPYLIRRAEENTSVAGQTGRELSLISMEMKRRKKSKQ